ncbi:MXAN_6640 family putative metalloprotease [Nocardioides coralli]|uniref:MXAN_6640 family putative metalloprotease n=1 Tax=Nocardioides coralli TaxID=2872154 RepID=UPI001CA43F76|nr:MXAN_6640 family putative metalloprotease [Nocardioides coralli]QZY29664.1 hypothetical protein K6T13_02930 [Nocardioides coralli]
MRAPIVTVLAAVLLATPLAPGAVADPVGKGDPATAGPVARAEAEAALDAALALVPEDAAARSRSAAPTQSALVGRQATMLLHEVMRTRGDLGPEDRERADRLLARPTGSGDPYLDYGTAPTASHCDAVICVHWVTDGSNRHAPDLTDSGGVAGVPDVVEETLTTTRQVHDTYTGSGYRRPDPDGTKGGGSDLVDIYLGDIGDRGIYGYCTSDQPDPVEERWNRWAYCAIDEDFRRSQFPTNTPRENRQVTLAHEYFHAVQFAYDAFEDGWIMEATATWAEEQLFDGVDDNRFYLKYGQLRQPRLPLDEYDGGLAPYGQWIFFEYLTQRWDATGTGTLPTIMLDIWEELSGRAGDPDAYSTQAVQRALKDRGTHFTDVYGEFAAANRQPSRSYEEGRASAYKKARVTTSMKLRRSKRDSGLRRTTLDHLTHQAARFRTDDTTGSGWKLRVDVDLAGRASAPVAILMIKKTSGDVVYRTLKLSKRGEGTGRAPFRADSVKFVELVLVNASRRTSCWDGGGSADYACLGNPRDDFRRASYRARVVRR